MNPSLGRNFEALDPLEWLARMSDHMPDPGQHRTILYGQYANRVRGARQGEEPSAKRPPPRHHTTRSWTCACAVGVIALLQIVVPTPATAQTIVSNGWEDGTLQGWEPRGSVTLISTTEAFATGTRSLKTTGRTATWNGPTINAAGWMCNGGRYSVSVW